MKNLKFRYLSFYYFWPNHQKSKSELRILIYFSTYSPLLVGAGFKIHETAPVTPPIKLVIFFNLKNFNRNFIFAFFLQTPLTRFVWGLQTPFIRFCTHICVFACIFFLHKHYFGVTLFFCMLLSFFPPWK